MLCHSPVNLLGAVEHGQAFTGNAAGGAGGKAPPLTPLFLAGRGFDIGVLAQTLKTGVTPTGGTVGDDMGLVIREETSKWNEADRRAVAAYLLNID